MWLGVDDTSMSLYNPWRLLAGQYKGLSQHHLR
jgi:hypothetical protein